MVSLQFLSSHALSLSPFKPHNSSCCSVGIFLHYPFFCRKTFPYRPLPTGWITFILFHWKFVFMFIGVLFYCIARYFVLSLSRGGLNVFTGIDHPVSARGVCVTWTVHKTFFTGQNQVGNKKNGGISQWCQLAVHKWGFSGMKGFPGWGGERNFVSLPKFHPILSFRDIFPTELTEIKFNNAFIFISLVSISGMPPNDVKHVVCKQSGPATIWNSTQNQYLISFAQSARTRVWNGNSFCQKLPNCLNNTAQMCWVGGCWIFFLKRTENNFASRRRGNWMLHPTNFSRSFPPCFLRNAMWQLKTFFFCFYFFKYFWRTSKNWLANAIFGNLNKP